MSTVTGDLSYSRIPGLDQPLIHRSRQMATNASPFIVNIVPLQNIPTNILGTVDVTALQSQVANLQTMVNTSNHTIYADAFSNFTPTNPYIDVYSGLNLSNVGIYSNGSAVTLTASGSSSTSNTSTPSYTINKGSSITNAGASTIITFVSTFSSVPSVTLTPTGYLPNFLTIDNISISSFKVYSWSGTIKSPAAPFQWLAIA